MSEVKEFLKNQTTRIKEYIKSNEDKLNFKIVSEGNIYFTVENEEGYRAYLEAELIEGFRFTTKHKPNRKTGTGHYFACMPFDSTDSMIIKKLNETLLQSKTNILLGIESVDDRNVAPSRKYFY